jgi:hypothetical protein
MEITLRPHHLLDFLRDYGYGIRYQPHEYGHALHMVADRVMNDLDQEVVFVVAAGDICRPCRHLHADGSCDDTMIVENEKISKQAYNDALDRRLWSYLELDKCNRMTAREFFRLILHYLDGIEVICTHPGEEKVDHKRGLSEGLSIFGIA